MIKYIIFLMLLMLPMALAQEGNYYVVTFAYSDKGFTMTKVVVQPVDFIPAPYAKGDYKIQVKRVDGSVANEQAFTPPEKGYFVDRVTDEGIKGEFVEQESIYLDFYLPYDPKGKEIVVTDDKGKTQAVIDVSVFSAPGKTDQTKQTWGAFLVLIGVLLIGFYFLKRKTK